MIALSTRTSEVVSVTSDGQTACGKTKGELPEPLRVILAMGVFPTGVSQLRPPFLLLHTHSGQI